MPASKRSGCGDVTGHCGELPEPDAPFRYATNARNGMHGGRMITEPIEMCFDVPWLEEAGTYGRARPPTSPMKAKTAWRL